MSRTHSARVVPSLGIVLACISFSSHAQAALVFSDVAPELGVEVESNSYWGAGVAFFDIDGDGDLDLYVVDGDGDPNLLFRNDGNRVFTEVGSQAGVNSSTFGKAVVPADIDNDGDADLLLTSYNPSDTNLLFRNDGGTFVDITAAVLPQQQPFRHDPEPKVDLVLLPDEEAEEDDPRWELIRQLVEYKKFKDAAQFLGLQEVKSEEFFATSPEVPDLSAPPPVAQVGVFDLIRAFQRVLKRFENTTDIREIVDDRYTVADKIEHLLETILAGSRVPFESLFSSAASRSEVIVTFLAMLELIKLNHLQVEQEILLGTERCSERVLRNTTSGRARRRGPHESESLKEGCLPRNSSSG